MLLSSNVQPSLLNTCNIMTGCCGKIELKHRYPYGALIWVEWFPLPKILNHTNISFYSLGPRNLAIIRAEYPVISLETWDTPAQPQASSRGPVAAGTRPFQTPIMCSVFTPEGSKKNVSYYYSRLYVTAKDDF